MNTIELVGFVIPDEVGRVLLVSHQTEIPGGDITPPIYEVPVLPRHTLGSVGLGSLVQLEAEHNIQASVSDVLRSTVIQDEGCDIICNWFLAQTTSPSRNIGLAGMGFVDITRHRLLANIGPHAVTLRSLIQNDRLRRST